MSYRLDKAGFASKWSDQLTDQRFTMIPILLLENQRTLGISPLELNVLIHLVSYRYYANSPINPSLSTIAKRMDCNRKTVQRMVHSLESKQLINITFVKGETSIYTYGPLIQKLITMDRGVRGPWTPMSDPPGTRVSTKKEGKKEEDQQLSVTERIQRANFKKKPAGAQPIKNIKQLAAYETSGEWPDELKDPVL